MTGNSPQLQICSHCERNWVWHPREGVQREVSGLHVVVNVPKDQEVNATYRIRGYSTERHPL